MKIHEILVESQDLQEGPILNKIGSAVGKGVGALAKGVGAVAGTGGGLLERQFAQLHIDWRGLGGGRVSVEYHRGTFEQAAFL